MDDTFALPLSLAHQVRDQRQWQHGKKIYSLHMPQVECIGKGKAHKPYEFEDRRRRRIGHNESTISILCAWSSAPSVETDNTP